MVQAQPRPIVTNAMWCFGPSGISHIMSGKMLTKFIKKLVAICIYFHTTSILLVYSVAKSNPIAVSFVILHAIQKCQVANVVVGG